ncbi:acyltransferase [Ancylostoma caninum]|uniref:Acyltransferase n=1 Tax=Ancylostoma caninum TaxID=29170 RepID=A0A368GSL0_ANCCA|nr:acyltransferase [Ancylostoma caninum]
MLGRREDIQGLRGWAILMVVLFHFFPDYFPNGYLGVDVFLVISGFLIAMILQRDSRIHPTVFITFYYKRVKRILPLYYVTIIGILVALISLLPTTYRGVNDGSSTKAIFLISNFKKQDADLDYEKELLGAEDLFTHTWSLSVEMQWYFLVPLIFLSQRLTTNWKKSFFTGLFCSILVLNASILTSTMPDHCANRNGSVQGVSVISCL